MKAVNVVINKYRVPVYRSTLWVVVTNNIIKAIDQIEDGISVKMHDDHNRNSTRAYTFAYVKEQGSKVFFLFLRPNSQIGELFHEIKHVVNLIFLWHGVRLSASNDESECYFIENIANKVASTVKRYHKLYPKPQKKVTKNWGKDLEMSEPSTILAS